MTWLPCSILNSNSINYLSNPAGNLEISGCGVGATYVLWMEVRREALFYYAWASDPNGAGLLETVAFRAGYSGLISANPTANDLAD